MFESVGQDLNLDTRGTKIIAILSFKLSLYQADQLLGRGELLEVRSDVFSWTATIRIRGPSASGHVPGFGQTLTAPEHGVDGARCVSRHSERVG